MDLDDRAHRCRVMWEKARNMYGAFFTELSDAMALMPAEDFEKWCFKSVGVSLSVAIKASEVLKATDQARVQSELKATVRAAKETKKQEILELKAKQAETQLKTMKTRVELRDQEAVISGLALAPISTAAAEILTKLSTRRSSTRIENGLDYLQLQKLVKSGAEGIDPATRKKWKWEKWAVLAIGRPMSSIRHSMTDAKNWLAKTGRNRPVSEIDPFSQIEDFTDEGRIKLRIVSRD